MDLYFEITFAHSTDRQLAYSVWAQRHMHMYMSLVGHACNERILLGVILGEFL